MMQIGVFSQMGKTTIDTLRHYDAIGLLKPAYVDTQTHYRFYTTDQLWALHRIQSLRQAGLSIDEIVRIHRGESLEAVLTQRQQALRQTLHAVQAQLHHLAFILSGSEELTMQQYQATIKKLPACTVYYKEMTVPHYDAYFSLIPAIGKECLRANPDLQCMVPPYCFIMYLDGEYRETDFHVRFCESVTCIGRETETIHFTQMPPVTVVSVMHRGPYSTLSAAYAYAFAFIEQNGYTVADVPRESYIDGIWNRQDETEWLTELQIPIVP